MYSHAYGGIIEQNITDRKVLDSFSLFSVNNLFVVDLYYLGYWLLNSDLCSSTAET